MPTLLAIRKHWATRLDLVGPSWYCKHDFLAEKLCCFACGQTQLGGGALERAHIKARCEGGTDDVSNLHSLCHFCHKDSEFVNGDAYYEWIKGRSFFALLTSMAVSSGCGFNAQLPKERNNEFIRN